MSYLDINLLARARAKTAAVNQLGQPKLKLPEDPLPKPKPDLSTPKPPPHQPFGPGGLFGGAGQSPQNLANTMTSPIFSPLTKAFLGMSGMAGLGYLSSAFGTDNSQAWNTLTQGSTLKTASTNFVANALAGITPPAQPMKFRLPSSSTVVAPAATLSAAELARRRDAAQNQGILGKQLGAYSRWRSSINYPFKNIIEGPGSKSDNKGFELLWDNRGNMGEMFGTFYLADKGLTHLAKRPSIYVSGRDAAGNKIYSQANKGWRTFFKPQESTEAMKNVLARTGANAGRAGKAVHNAVRFASGPAKIIGPMGTPIAAGMELYDILKHGYKIDEFRDMVTPDAKYGLIGGTVLGGAKAWPGMSYLGSALNATMNPIRSTDLLVRDTKGLLFGNDKMPSVFSIGATKRELEADTRQRWAARVQQLRDKAKQVGYAGLTRGERADLEALSNPNRKVFD